MCHILCQFLFKEMGPYCLFLTAFWSKLGFFPFKGFEGQRMWYILRQFLFKEMGSFCLFLIAFLKGPTMCNRMALFWVNLEVCSSCEAGRLLSFIQPDRPRSTHPKRLQGEARAKTSKQRAQAKAQNKASNTPTKQNPIRLTLNTVASQGLQFTLLSPLKEMVNHPSKKWSILRHS